ncbi:cell wall-active antibiotics response protein LiaF [Sporosarcina thermotolerans]|uniref:Cell wall-active antibiotics response protein LiaF n=1 Tax=Sporosarcina thermotolerans TaxID=633404 RepID=A0AAW9AHV1_9BACL|nr:cell wall-active antibiotics response protein LiaF [Sporosarcina thermotolerans]MDW0118833.1 cell wall-active antibiotics response protein LiaF [Sporosarcina thermotolerans]WHT48522.1 cell wall-active antibiotics response protein LiaF [Sporosarcina thermotolerans]
MKKLETNKVIFWIAAFLFLIFVETTFLSNGNFIFLLLGAGFIYYGFKKRSKWMTFLGIFFIIMALMTLWSLRMLLFTAFVYVLFHLWKGVPAEQMMRPLKEFQKPTPNGIWKNKWFSTQTSPFSSYEWEDIQIQGFFGDIHVDVTDTVLPKGTSFISIRQGFGRIKIDLPYEIPVRIHYNTLFGEARILDLSPKRMLNETLHFKDGYEGEIGYRSELIISLATWIGDIEVVRK